MGEGGIFLSIVIPVYNAAATLPRMLESLRKIAPEHRWLVEPVLIDDGSTDQSSPQIETFIETNLFPTARQLTQSNRGQSAARNAGLAAASGQWIMLLDADDELNVDPIPFLRQCEGASCIVFAVALHKRHRRLITLRPRRIALAHHLDAFTANCPFFPSGFCFRKEAVHQPFETEYRCLEDWAWWLNNPALFRDMQVFRKVVGVTVHIHGGNVSSQFRRRGQTRTRIAQHALANFGDALSAKQRNNLLIQAQIGRLQLGEAAPWKTYFHFPCNPVLYGKLWIYTFFKQRLAKIEPYAQNDG